MSKANKHRHFIHSKFYGRKFYGRKNTAANIKFYSEDKILEMNLKFRGENMVKTVEKYLTK